MKHTHPKSHLDLFTAIAGILAFGSGLLLFTQFHIGLGAMAIQFAGLSRATWANTHGMCCVFFAVLTIHHCAHRKTALVRLFTRFPHRFGQLYLLSLSCTVLITGLAAWFVPLYGSGGLHAARHVCVDIHNVSALLLLAGLALHVGRRWRRLFHSSQV